VWCSCSVKTERFRGELLTMGRYTNPASFFTFFAVGHTSAQSKVGHGSSPSSGQVSLDRVRSGHKIFRLVRRSGLFQKCLINMQLSSKN